MENLLSILKTCDSVKSNINPTLLYNEGWMLRLMIQQSINENLTIAGVDFSKINNWTSEALISSPFVGLKKKPERHTHADAVLGDFIVDYETRGEVAFPEPPNIFGIIEAKMGSNLSSGTTHAINYNQTARNIACIAHNTFNILYVKLFFS